MTQEEIARAVNVAVANTAAVHVTGHSVTIVSSMVRLGAIEQLAADMPINGRGAWLMSLESAAALHGLLGQLLDAVAKQGAAARANQN